MNPAVTVGVLAAGAMGAGEAVGYIVSQLIGGIVGALFFSAVLGGAETGLGMPALAHNLALGAHIRSRALTISSISKLTSLRTSPSSSNYKASGENSLTPNVEVRRATAEKTFFIDANWSRRLAACQRLKE